MLISENAADLISSPHDCLVCALVYAPYAILTYHQLLLPVEERHVLLRGLRREHCACTSNTALSVWMVDVLVELGIEKTLRGQTDVDITATYPSTASKKSVL